MNARLRLLIGLGWLATALTVHSAHYSIDWFTIDGGGGTSAHGAFTMCGTFGQSDSFVSSGGSFRLEGGFWSGVTLVQPSGAPLLKVRIAGSSAVISWPLDAAGYRLQETTQFGGINWSDTPQPVADTASERTVTVPLIGTARFYRLRKP
jgi:hypothetical protein